MTDQIESVAEENVEPVASRSVVNNNHNSVEVEMQEVIGASFLGILCLILLMLLVRAQRRNRLLTAKLAQRAPRLALLERPHKRQVNHD